MENGRLRFGGTRFFFPLGRPEAGRSGKVQCWCNVPTASPPPIDQQSLSCHSSGSKGCSLDTDLAHPRGGILLLFLGIARPPTWQEGKFTLCIFCSLCCFELCCLPDHTLLRQNGSSKCIFFPPPSLCPMNTSVAKVMVSPGVCWTACWRRGGTWTLWPNHQPNWGGYRRRFELEPPGTFLGLPTTRRGGGLKLSSNDVKRHPRTLLECAQTTFRYHTQGMCITRDFVPSEQLRTKGRWQQQGVAHTGHLYPSNNISGGSQTSSIDI